MAVHVDVTFDCADAAALAVFWKLALGYADEPPPAPFTTREAWLESLGVPEAEWSAAAWLHDPAGVGPRLSLLQVPEPKVAKNRVHLDLRVSAAAPPGERWGIVTAAVERLVAAGASVVSEHAGHHVTMTDPEGNEFCVL